MTVTKEKADRAAIDYLHLLTVMEELTYLLEKPRGKWRNPKNYIESTIEEMKGPGFIFLKQSAKEIHGLNYSAKTFEDLLKKIENGEYDEARKRIGEMRNEIRSKIRHLYEW